MLNNDRPTSAPSSPPSTTASPRPSRVPAVDTVRGLALLGIAAVNLPFLAQPVSALMQPHQGLDLIARFVVAWLAEGKFFVLFSFLFGWGFAAQLQVPDDLVPQARLRLLRRLAGLGVIGVAHATLVFHGDILVLYALLGLPLLLVHAAPTRRLVGIAVAGTLAWGLTLAALALLTPTLVDLSPPQPGPGYLGSFVDAVQQRARDWPAALVVVLLFNGPMAFAAFCVGVLAARARLFDADSPVAAQLRRRGPALAVIGLAINAWYALASVGALGTGALAMTGAVSLAVGGPCLSAAYLAAALAIAERAGTYVSAAGRMSLTVYVLEGVLAGFVFNGYGFGLHGQIGALGTLLMTPVIYLVADGLAATWLQFARQGPLEALLRAITGPMPRHAAES